jgi:transposase InsO family protein
MRFNAKTGNIRVKTYQRKRKERRPKGYRVLELDTIVRYIEGVKRYTLTAIDTETRTAFAACYTNHGSRSAADFLSKVIHVIPDCPTALQTDNGSEFALHFQRSVKKQQLLHFHTYPRTPKMNAHVERFNRTLDEEFLKYHKPLMRDDIAAFNDKLVDWLVWYNAERPHSALGQRAPLRVMMEGVNPEECQMWWTRTQI